MYFDTPEDQCVRENQDGYNDRAKYRIRIYNASGQVIKLEKKYMVRGMKAKQACSISREQCERLLCGRNMGECPADQALLQQFLCERAAEGLAPKVIVEYVRTPYVYGIGNLRLTFDRNITSISAGCSDFFAKALPGRAILEPGRHILEVKYDTMIPASIVDCMNAPGISLCGTSFSKYTLCRQYAA